MPGTVKIALQSPIPAALKTTFSIRLKKELIKESGVYHPRARILLLNGSSGSFGDMMGTMLRCGIVDESFNWIFGDGHVIVTGNCLDGSPESVALLWLIYAMESKAVKRGGYLHFLPGPSELANSQGAWRSLQPDYAARNSRSTHKYAILFDGNNELYRWLLTKNILEQIGDMAILQCNLPQESRDFLPKFPGKRFPEGVLNILQLPLTRISDSDLAFIHRTLQVPILVIAEANTGKVIISEQNKSARHYCESPILIKDDKGHLLMENGQLGIATLI
ncbi:hypothetical protein [Chitinophaga sp. YIM B06452]|uniref:hypothetical protein n=1 Tax=Chitinophaga sp. YIM B06452 TaxID=3082158 RepID=UPI0031FF1E95